MGSIDYQERIPNNVDLQSDKRLQRALEAWQPDFIQWWMDMGPDGFQQDEVYLRTAVSVDKDGWAQFGHVKMPDYRWGIFLTPFEGERKVNFGDHMGDEAWQAVPGEHRNTLRRIIVTQGDTEPASVEQQRQLGHTCPSLYDLRNLFQVNVEEGRHLWAMVYLLHRYFGRDGREEAEALLERRSGDVDSPRILGAFNEPCDDWLSFFCFTTFTDRDGKYQLRALSESGFDPLARTCNFMLTEEAHHMFVGQTGIARILQKAAERMKEGDPRDFGAIPVDMVQRAINFWYTVSLDLFGGEDSSNAANFFGAGLKGRDRETELTEHTGLGQIYTLEKYDAEGNKQVAELPLRRAMNEVLRDAYVADCEKVIKSWNRTLEKAGCDIELTLPDRKFHRAQGVYAGLPFDPQGRFVGHATYEAKKDEWLINAEDKAYLASIMNKPHYAPGQYADWISPPPRGINGQDIDYEYVRFATPRI
ncbi:MAG: benzoyl-CoA 2,3-epoxidase subunit BoxB [Myxococcales bacterium]|nr:benzoyl-CoA 2,3-epoxidase subunit BoxB [Myxococcales bacterium]MCB9540357.1 benzoyl-CoA 2,3-epoxidase subunit BoxB [Myxococcales bacterium]